MARPLEELGHTVTGIDLSRAMLAQAQGRLARLVEGDASRLPLRRASFDAVVAVWAVHLIGDLEALMSEVVRILRPGSRLLVVPSTPDIESNDLADIAFRFGKLLGRGWDRSWLLAPRLRAFGFELEGDVQTAVYEFDETPNQRADSIERRDWSSLWDVDALTWDRVVQPVVDDLRALPRPDAPRACRHHHFLSVYSLTGKQ